jgi:arsenate reductase (thioredoxin)
MARIYNVLFLCTGNSARSIMAEALLDAIGSGRFKAYSAGSHPQGEVNPLALELIEKNGLSAEGLRSKNWSEFAEPGAPHVDFVFTVCDSAAAEPCPVWPGQPITAHWGIPDPARADGNAEAKRRAFLTAYQQLSSRILAFVNIPLTGVDPFALKSTLEDIGAR